MYGSLFSVLLLGLLPAAEQSFPSGLQALSIAPPAGLQAEVLSGLEQRLSASGVIVIDYDSGQMVFGKNAQSAMPMASLTKLMTALLIVENHQMEEMVTIPAWAPSIEGNTAKLPPGEEFSVGDLLSALLVLSANDAAKILAEYHSGSEATFALAMNERAKELGLSSTSFENAAGFDDDLQHASPRDLAWLASYVLRQPDIAVRMSVPKIRIASRTGKSLTLVHTHQLLQQEDTQNVLTALPENVAFSEVLPSFQASAALPTGILAGKTGTTPNAGQCLLSLTTVGGRRYVAVLMNSKDRYADMNTLLAALAH